MRRKAVFLLVLLGGLLLQTLALGTTPRVERQEALQAVETFIEAGMKEWKVPGLAIAIIEDGEVSLSKGYGSRNVEAGQAVTPRTLFAIGSNTKSFTATVMGMLDDEGKLDWDTPVRDYLPKFRLHDEVATRQITPRDLLTLDSIAIPLEANVKDIVFTRTEHE